jgi:hypothetical protein
MRSIFKRRHSCTSIADMLRIVLRYLETIGQCESIDISLAQLMVSTSREIATTTYSTTLVESALHYKCPTGAVQTQSKMEPRSY